MDFEALKAKARTMAVAEPCIRHWWNQRLTAIALIPLSLWLGFSLTSLPGADYAEVVGWVQQPLNAIFLMLFALASFYHAVLGIEVVIEDYVLGEQIRNNSILATRVVLGLLALLMLFAVLKIAFSG